MKAMTIRCLTFALMLSCMNPAVSDCATVATKIKALVPGTNCTGVNWKRAPEKDRIRYCELIAEKLGVSSTRWEFFYKGLSVNFNTDNLITLGLSLDESAKVLKEYSERGRY